MAQDPETADYRSYPKGPNFLAVVIGFCVMILIVVVATIFVLHRGGKNIFPMKTRATPSQTMVVVPRGAVAGPGLSA